jgi:hypothetical protein
VVSAEARGTLPAITRARENPRQSAEGSQPLDDEHDGHVRISGRSLRKITAQGGRSANSSTDVTFRKTSKMTLRRWTRRRKGSKTSRVRSASSARINSPVLRHGRQPGHDRSVCAYDGVASRGSWFLIALLGGLWHGLPSSLRATDSGIDTVIPEPDGESRRDTSRAVIGLPVHSTPSFWPQSGTPTILQPSEHSSPASRTTSGSLAGTNSESLTIPRRRRNTAEDDQSPAG